MFGDDFLCSGVCSRWVDLLADGCVLETGVFAGDAPADACLDEATTADLPPLPVDFRAFLSVDAIFVDGLDDFGVAGSFRLSFCALALSTPDFAPEAEFCRGGVGVGTGVDVNDEAAEDCWE